MNSTKYSFIHTLTKKLKCLVLNLEKGGCVMTFCVPEKDEATVSIVQASELLNVSRRTVYNWIKTGKVKYSRTVGGSIRILYSSLWTSPEQNRLIADSRTAQVISSKKGKKGVSMPFLQTDMDE